MTGFVSLNGPDNSGKSTQVRLLADRWEGFCDLGPVRRHDPVPWMHISRPLVGPASRAPRTRR